MQNDNFNGRLYDDFLYICDLYGWSVIGSLERDRRIKVKGDMMRSVPIYFFLLDSDFQTGESLKAKLNKITDTFCQDDDWNRRYFGYEHQYVFFGFSYEAIDEMRNRLSQLTEKTSNLIEKDYKSNERTI